MYFLKKTENKPLIGVTFSPKASSSMWYCSWFILRLLGARVRLLTPDNHQDFEDCAAYIISGGNDIDPKLYNQHNKSSLNIDTARDRFETALITHALKHKKSLLGICRGMQMINIMHGGNLYQNAQDIFDGFLPTTSTIKKIFGRKKVFFTTENIVTEQKTLLVNSIHHQAIDKLGCNLKTIAKDSFGIIQAFEGKDIQDHFIIGVQWHPEFMLYDRRQIRLFKKFLKSIKI